MDKPITIFIADDHQIVLDGLKLLLQNANLQIVGTATNGQDAYSAITRLNPDVALLDQRMPGLTGIQLIINLKRKVETKFIILSMVNDIGWITNAKNNGANGYLLKNVGKKELIDSIIKVNHGLNCFNDEYQFSEIPNKTKLGKREIEILRLIIEEKTSHEIAIELGLSLFTVDTHRKNIYRKTGAKNLVALVKLAIEQGIV